MKLQSFQVPILISCLAFVLMGQGCGSSTTTSKGPDGGVWKSADKGVTWTSKKALVSGIKVTATAALFNVLDMAMDPQDNKTIYLATNDHGLAYTLDGGDSWQLAKIESATKVNAIAVDPKNKCTVYAASANKIYKTTDAGATWTQIKKQFGDMTDGRRVIQVVLDPVDANTVYDVCRYGILKSTDGGETWIALNLISPPGTIKINSLAIDPKNNKSLVYTGVSTLQFSTDGGVNWQPKKLPTTQAGSVVMFDPLDSSVMYLGTTPPPAKN